MTVSLTLISGVGGSGVGSSGVVYIPTSADVSLSTWNPSDKGINITLSNGNLTALGAASWNGVRGTTSRASLKFYYEIVLDVIGTAGNTIVGIGRATATTGNYLGVTADGWGWQCTSATSPRTNGGVGASYGAQATVGNIIGVLLDIDAGTLSYTKNGVDQGVCFASGVTGTLFPMVGLNTAAQVSARFSRSSWTYTPPAGYEQWP